MWTAIISAISGLFGAVKSGFDQYKERKLAEHEVRMAQEEAKKQLAMKTIEAQAELGKLQVASTGKYFKYFTFIMWFGPFAISTVFPEYGEMIFKNWAIMPPWYSQSILVIMFAVWGIQFGKDSISSIFTGLSAFFQYNSKQRLNRKLFYDTLRSTQGNISEYEVKLYEKALDALSGKSDTTE